MSKAKIMKETDRYRMHPFSEQMNNLMKDVIVVWEELILDSDEVSATGGLPK